MMTRNFNWQKITKTLSHSVFLVREDASFIYVNDHACEVLKYSREELLTKRLFDIVPQYQNIHHEANSVMISRATQFECSVRTSISHVKNRTKKMSDKCSAEASQSRNR